MLDFTVQFATIGTGVSHHLACEGGRMQNAPAAVRSNAIVFYGSTSPIIQKCCSSAAESSMSHRRPVFNRLSSLGPGFGI